MPLSGIRPEPLGRYLTEHPLTFAVAAVRDDLAPGYSTHAHQAADPVSSEDGLTFSCREMDHWGMPKVSIQYALADREHAELGQAIAHLTTAAK